jgi:hypothetical protein
MLTQDQLLRRYQNGRRFNLPRLYLATFIGFLIPVFILVGRPAFMLYRTVTLGITYPEPFQSVYLHINMLGGLLLIGVAAYWFLQWMKFGEPQNPNARPLNLSLFPGCNEYLEVVRHKLGIATMPRFTVTTHGLASASRLKGESVVGISPYLGMMYEEAPDMARFALAHEMSHVAQNDIRMLARLDWLALFTRQLLFWYLIVQAVVIILSSLGIGMFMGMTLGEEGPKQYKNMLLFAFFQGVALIVIFAVARFALLIVRKLRHQSELLADLGAAAVTEPGTFAKWLVGKPAVKAVKWVNPVLIARLEAAGAKDPAALALKLDQIASPSAESTPHSSLASTHPSDLERAHRLRRYAAAWGSEPSDIPLPPLPSQTIFHQNITWESIKSNPFLKMLGGVLLINAYMDLGVQPIGGSSQFNPVGGIVGGVGALLAVGTFASMYSDDGPQLPASHRIRTFPDLSLLIISAVVALITVAPAWASWTYLHRRSPTITTFDMLRNKAIHDRDWIQVTGVEMDGGNPQVFRLIDEKNDFYRRWDALRSQVQSLPEIHHSNFYELTPDELQIINKLSGTEERKRLAGITQDVAHFFETDVTDQLVKIPEQAIEATSSQPEIPTFKMPEIDWKKNSFEYNMRNAGIDDKTIRQGEEELKALQSISSAKSAFTNLMRPGITWIGVYEALPNATSTTIANQEKQPLLGFLVPSLTPYPDSLRVLICDFFFAALAVAVWCCIQLIRKKKTLVDVELQSDSAGENKYATSVSM